MYFRYKGIKYFIDVKKDEYIANPKLILTKGEPEIWLKIGSWLGNRPQSVELIQEPTSEQLTSWYQGIPCLQQMPGVVVTPPMSYVSLIQQVHKQREVIFTMFVSFSRDVLAHNDGGFKKELVSKAVADDDAEHWGKFDVTAYKVVGIEAPDQLIVTFKVGLRKRL